MILTSARPKRPVYLLRPTEGVDSYGEPFEDWTTPERILLRGADLQRLSTEETIGLDGTRIENSRRLYLPGTADLREHDRIEVGDETWRVEGTPTVVQGFALGTRTSAALSRAKAS